MIRADGFRFCIIMGILFYLGGLRADDDFGGVQPIEIGNFALPSTQWPTSPAFSFGQNIIPKGAAFLELYALDQNDECENYFIGLPDILYGITDKLSFLLAAPLLKSREKDNHSKGVGDIVVQMEYAYYMKPTKTDLNFATVLVALSLPTGSLRKNPRTGYGSTSALIGLTAVHLGIDWYVFTGQGATVTTWRNDTKYGDIYHYQFGLGHNLCHLQKSIVLGLLELNGEHRKRDRLNGVLDCNSGGNIIYLGPSIFFSRSKVILQGGFQMPILQNLFGNQSDVHMRSSIEFAYTF